MAQGKGQSGARREPVFDSSPELRVAAGDRPGGAGKPPARTKTSAQSAQGAPTNAR